MCFHVVSTIFGTIPQPPTDRFPMSRLPRQLNDSHAALPPCRSHAKLRNMNSRRRTELARGVHSTGIYLGEKRLFLYSIPPGSPRNHGCVLDLLIFWVPSGLLGLALETRNLMDVMVTSYCRTAGCLIFRGLGCCEVVNSRIPVLDLGSKMLTEDLGRR